MAEYFNEHAIDRELLLWAVATRRQLDRWEACVAEIVRLGQALPGELVWRSSAERHLVFVSARHLVRATALSNDPPLDAPLSDGITDVRNLLEHWDENAPIFNKWPQVIPEGDAKRRFPSRKRFAEQHPEVTPFSSFAWDSTSGPKLLPTIPAHMLHAALDVVEAAVLQRRPELAEFVSERDPSPWLGEDAGNDRWWPKRLEGSSPRGDRDGRPS